MKQVKIYTGKTKQFRIMQGEHIISYQTDDDRHCDEHSYKTIDARVEMRLIGTRSWKNYARLGFETVERATEFVEIVLANEVVA